MPTLLLALLLILSTVVPAVAGDVFVNGYLRDNGTYVQPHWRSAPDGNAFNNWSTSGNVNPYTGQPGTQQPNVLGGSGGFNTGTGNTRNLFGTVLQQPRIRSGW